MEHFFLETPQMGFVDITAKVKGIVHTSNVTKGLCQVFVPHTTAAVTINENADPDVCTDMMAALEHMVPKLSYRHAEGNSPAHLLSSLIGCSLTVPIENNSLMLGTWQGIYLCEFDGPRRRKILVKVIGN